MKNLLRSDYNRFFKDKLFLVVCILAVIFAVITPLLYGVIMGTTEEIDPLTQELLSGYVTAKGQFFGSFSFGNNLGLIAPLLIGIILFKDFSFGTIRNKIIGGHSRTRIFFSMFIVCLTTLFGIVLAHALLTLAISLPFFDYQTTPFGWTDFAYLMESLAFELLIYVFVAAFVSWLCVSMKNVGLVIVLYIAVVFGFTMIAGILQVVLMFIGTNQSMETTVNILNFFQRINLFNSSNTIGTGTAYTLKDTLYYLVPSFIGTIGMLGLGVLKLNKSDLK